MGDWEFFKDLLFIVFMWIFFGIGVVWYDRRKIKRMYNIRNFHRFVREQKKRKNVEQ